MEIYHSIIHNFYFFKKKTLGTHLGKWYPVLLSKLAASLDLPDILNKGDNLPWDWEHRKMLHWGTPHKWCSPCCYSAVRLQTRAHTVRTVCTCHSLGRKKNSGCTRKRRRAWNCMPAQHVRFWCRLNKVGTLHHNSSWLKMSPPPRNPHSLCHSV